jgi:hypothetical protein
MFEADAMNDSSAPEQTLPEGQAAGEPVKPQQFLCSPGHTLLALVGMTFILFEIVFIDLYSDNFWFSLNIQWLGIPTILILAVLAHGLLVALESKRACRWLSLICKGTPPVVYRKWLSIDESGITFGIRHLKWEVIDELALTWLGTLQIKSRALCGDQTAQPDIVLKVPFGAAAQREQKQFLELIRSARTDLKVNNRLEKRVNSPIVKGQNIMQFAMATMMMMILVDVANSLFTRLEMLKHYYQAQKSALAGGTDAIATATAELTQADQIRDHPLPISYVTTQFLSRPAATAEVLLARSDALMAMNRTKDAIADSKNVVDCTPENFRAYLHLARQLQQVGEVEESRRQIELSITKHKDSLLPRLYLISSLRHDNPHESSEQYKKTLDHLMARVYDGEPVWPPGGNRFVTDVFYQPDVHFVFDRLITDTAQSEPNAEKSAVKQSIKQLKGRLTQTEPQ